MSKKYVMIVNATERVHHQLEFEADSDEEAQEIAGVAFNDGDWGSEFNREIVDVLFKVKPGKG